MYFLINHDTGVVESAETLEIATRLIEEWINHGTETDDISVYNGRRVNFDIRVVRRVVFKPSH